MKLDEIQSTLSRYREIILTPINLTAESVDECISRLWSHYSIRFPPLIDEVDYKMAYAQPVSLEIIGSFCTELNLVDHVDLMVEMPAVC